MTNEIIIRDSTLNELTRIQNVINPIVSEQINAHYTFSFDTVVDENTQYLNNKHIIEVDDDYFRIARVVKSRDTSIMSVTVECEHISYDLLDNDEYPMPFEEYEGNVEFMAHELLNGTPFSIGKFEGAGYYFIKPNSDNIRGTLIELANLIGCELEYDKFTINFLNRRGVVSNQKFKLGENLIGVTEEIDYTGGYPRKALEVDVVDLSQVPGYEYLLTIGLGDTVTTIEPILNINETLRIVSKEYNPFQKINPRVQIGNVLRDITDYLKEEDETPTDLGLKEFKIGDVDCLSLSGVEITESYRKYLEDGTPFEVTATVEYPTLEGLTGLFVERSNNFFGIRVKEINNGITTDYFYKDLDSLKTRKYPSTEDTVVLVIISYVSIDYLTANDEFKVYAVKFGQGEPDTDNYWLSEFRIGDIDCLALPGLQMQSADDEPTAIVEYEEKHQYEGFVLRLKEEYKGYRIKFFISYDDGYTDEYDYREPAYRYRTFPDTGQIALIVSVFNPDNNTEQQYFGVKFVRKEPEQSGGGDETLLIYNPNSELDILNNEIRMSVGSIEFQEGNSFIGNFSGGLLFRYADADISLINPYLVINLVAVNYETGNIKRICQYEYLHTVRPLNFFSEKSYVAINFQKSFAFNGFESNKWALDVIVGMIEGDIKYELLEGLILKDVEVWLKGKGIKKVEYAVLA